MRTIFLTAFFIFLSINSFSQEDKVAGDYALTIGTKDNNLLEYKLTLAQDGTFSFHYYSNLKNGVPPEKNNYGKGKWAVENNVITFSSDKQNDIDQKNTLNFTNTKARFVTKSPRDKSDRIIKTKLQFLESDIFWMARIDLFKI